MTVLVGCIKNCALVKETNSEMHICKCKVIVIFCYMQLYQGENIQQATKVKIPLLFISYVGASALHKIIKSSSGLLNDALTRHI